MSEPIRRGPRPGTRDKILGTTRSLLAAEGFDRLTVEAVASRSGVAKTTIYRHYRSRTDLALAVLSSMLDEIHAVPDTADSLADLATIIDRTAELLTGGMLGPIMTGLVAELEKDPELARAYREEVVTHRVSSIRSVLASGIARGQLRDDLDAEHLTDLALGPVYYRYFLAGTAFDDGFGERIVASLRLT